MYLAPVKHPDKKEQHMQRMKLEMLMAAILVFAFAYWMLNIGHAGKDATQVQEGNIDIVAQAARERVATILKSDIEDGRFLSIGDYPVAVPTYTGKYTKTIEEFVIHEFIKGQNMTTMQSAKAAIQGSIFQSLSRGFAIEDNATASRFLIMAKKLHKMYQSMQNDETITTGDGRSRQGMLPFVNLAADTLKNYMTRHDIDTVMKIYVWKNVDEDWKRQVFDYIQPQLHKEAIAFLMNPDVSFPEPDGMAGYRAVMNPRREHFELESNLLGSNPILK